MRCHAARRCHLTHLPDPRLVLDSYVQESGEKRWLFGSVVLLRIRIVFYFVILPRTFPFEWVALFLFHSEACP